jgi:hypothetical protein
MTLYSNTVAPSNGAAIPQPLAFTKKQLVELVSDPERVVTFYRFADGIYRAVAVEDAAS